MLEDVRFTPLHQLDVVRSQLERRPLEVHITWTARQDKTEIDVNDVPRSIDQYIIVMTIFDLEQILHQRIASQRVDEVGDRFLPVYAEKLLVDLPETLLL